MPLSLSGTNGATFPTWTTAARPASPSIGQTGYNTTLGILETWDGYVWSGDQPFKLNGRTVTTNYTIPAGTSAISAGPITISNGVTVTVSANTRYVIL